MSWDHLIINARLATLAGKQGWGSIESGAIGWKDGQLCFVGPMSDLPGPPQSLSNSLRSCPEGWFTPALIDCHTHLVFAGHRADEFEQRLSGVSYADIARAGGGILRSVRQTRAASVDELVEMSLPRALALRDDGVATVEIKSGYGLNLACERRMLQAARRIGELSGQRVRTSFLGAHTLPPEFSNDRTGYLDLLCEQILPTLADEGLIDAVDGYCESIAFSASELDRLFTRARQLGLPVKVHADQLSECGGAALVARHQGLSADHVEHTSAQGAAAMAVSGSVAVLLPGAYYALRETQRPPVDAFREHGVAMAVASDMNPGTSPLRSLRLALNMACVQFGLTPVEAVRGATVNAALALGLDRHCGTLELGKHADIAHWAIDHPAELAYWIGGALCQRLYIAGVAQQPGAASRTVVDEPSVLDC